MPRFFLSIAGAIKKTSRLIGHGLGSAIPIAPFEDLEKLKTLPAGIVVLRTMNIRKDYPESRIRRQTCEPNALQEITKQQ
ncbi:MAG TPA: hypothetical protein VGB68_06425 [Pyrinomonadaceae bacterium]|jgi:hypothetical protein